jgi:uncharacterized protein (DUF58 family)
MTATSDTTGVYTNLQDLIRLQHKPRGFSFLPRQPVHSLLSGRHASRLRGRGLNFEEIRRYLPGDDVRNIDWKVTARTQKTHTRVYTEERERPVLLVVDQRINMFFGTQAQMKSVTAAELAALAAWRVLDAGDRVGAMVFGDSDVVEIRPHRSRSRVMQILGEIVRMNRALSVRTDITPAPGMLNEVLRNVRRIATHDFLVGIVSDFHGMDAETRRLIKLVGQHNDVIACMVYDPIAASVPKGARLVVGDGDVQIEADTDQGKVRHRIEAVFNDRLATLKGDLTRLGIPVLPIETATPLARQLRQLLGQALAGGGR